VKKILDNIDVKSLYDEIDMSLWHGVHLSSDFAGNWANTSKQLLLGWTKHGNYNEPFSLYDGVIPKDLHDMLVDDFLPTKLYFKHPNLHKFFLWFTKTYGGKIARAVYYTTPPKYSVKKHRDALPDGQETRFEKRALHENKDRFHLVVSGEYVYTVHDEIECFRKGELWWFNNKMYHSSFNHGKITKINLVFDVAGSNWREMI
jgi:mannose-6-phosphate isomerase-like protein (cupin superfamily)